MSYPPTYGWQVHFHGRNTYLYLIWKIYQSLKFIGLQDMFNERNVIEMKKFSKSNFP